jgi:hypothetical protein
MAGTTVASNGKKSNRIASSGQPKLYNTTKLPRSVAAHLRCSTERRPRLWRVRSSLTSAGQLPGPPHGHDTRQDFCDRARA